MRTSLGTRAALLTGALLVATLLPAALVQAVPDSFPTPSSGLSLPRGLGEGAGNQTSLLQLVRVFEESTGLHIVLSEDSASVLSATRVAFMMDLDVPPQQVYPTFEAIMRVNRFALLDVSGEGQQAFSLVSMDSPARKRLIERARRVALEDVALYEQHPALLIQVALPLEHLDPSSVDSLEALVSDSHTTRILATRQPDGIVLIGFGPHVNDLVKLIRTLDSAAGRVSDAQPAGSD